MLTVYKKRIRLSIYSKVDDGDLLKKRDILQLFLLPWFSNNEARTEASGGGLFRCFC